VHNQQDQHVKPQIFAQHYNKIEMRPITNQKFNGSFSASEDKSETSDIVEEEHNPLPWSRQEMLSGRPDDYVGGYSPAYILNYRKQMEAKKVIKIKGYNTGK
jgi:hypothetical protein